MNFNLANAFFSSNLDQIYFTSEDELRNIQEIYLWEEIDFDEIFLNFENLSDAVKEGKIEFSKNN